MSMNQVRPFAAPGTVAALMGMMLLSVPCIAPAQVPQQLPQDGETEEIPDWEWPPEVEAPLRTFFEREDVEAIRADLTIPVPAVVDPAVLARQVGPEIGDLFRYVQRRIRYESYSGSLRGAGGALRSGGGNALDQSLLLRELLRLSGHQARLVRGRLGWSDAVALTGESRDDVPGRGDPWLRRIEEASDHWWVEVRDQGGWVAADPAFAVAALGEAPGRRGRPVQDVPDRFLATVQLELTLRGRRLAGVRLPLAAVFGQGVRVSAVPPAIEAMPDDADAGSSVVPTDESLVEAPPDPLDFQPVLDALPYAPVGATELAMIVGTRVTRTAPVAVDDLREIRLGVDIEVPPGRHVRAELPFGDDPSAQLTIVVAGGAVPAGSYTAQLARLYEDLVKLADAEVMALEAWRVRPDESEEEDEAASAMGPPRIPPLPEPVDSDAEPLVHPARALHVAALEAWAGFAEHGIEALGLALLGAADQLRTTATITPPAVRFVGINYRPPGAEPGSLTAWISDPTSVEGASGRLRATTQSALGVLQSAIAGQVLNRVADQPPVTAYDVTLRAVGSGSRLTWFSGGSGALEWPEVASQAAAGDLRAGGTVVGPARPIRRGGQELLAWWSMLTDSGRTAGRVYTPLGVAQGAVPIGPAVDLEALDSILATLHDLHVAGGWLLTLGDPDRAALRSLVPGACAATPLVADLLRAGAPADFVPPAFGAFCQRPGVS